MTGYLCSFLICVVYSLKRYIEIKNFKTKKLVATSGITECCPKVFTENSTFENHILSKARNATILTLVLLLTLS